MEVMRYYLFYNYFIMTKDFKHKELGWVAKYFLTDIIEWYKISDKDWLLVFWDNWITADKLLLLWFEEEDWIERAWIGYTDYDNSWHDVTWKKDFREAIEKYMPKITKQEIENLKDDPEDMSTIYVSSKRVINLLKSKGLLDK